MSEKKKNVTLATALNTYASKVSILKKSHLQERYRINQIQKHPICKKILRKITSVDIAEYRDFRLASVDPRSGRQISASTVRLEMSLLSNMFDIARIEWGYADSNPVTNVRKPKLPPGRERRLTNREERQILRYSFAHQNQGLYSIVVLALETAMRQGEILNLRWEHINLKSRIAHLPETKNGTKRDIPLSIKARDAIIRMGVKPNGKVFKYTSNGIKSTWRYMMQALDIKDCHFHDLRHTAVSKLFELGTLNTMEIAAISGHKSLSMLKRYTHLNAQRLTNKLEGTRSKATTAIINHLIPYPASIDEMPTGDTRLRLLDFELEVIADSKDAAIEKATAALLQKIILSLKNSETIPAPDQYLCKVDESKLVMIDPLNEPQYWV